MAQANRSKKVVKILGDNIVADERYYLNNPNLPTSKSTYAFTPEMIQEIEKCRNNIVYFAEHYFYISGFNGKEIIKLFGKQKQILLTIQNNKKILLVTSRQWGKTTLMTIVAIWTALFFPDQTVAIVANKQGTATEIFGKIRLAFIQMDNWIKGGVEEFNKTYFTLSNGSRIITSATSPDAIRGYSIDVLLLDEFAIIPKNNATEFWAAVTPTLATRFNNNKNAKLIVASTPKGIGNKFHELVSGANQGNNDFVVEKALWHDVPGRDEAWKEEQLKSMDYDSFIQEYECGFLGNSGSPFEASMFTKFDEEMKEPINILENGNYLIWAKPEEEKIYVMGVDTSEGIGQDYSVIQIFDITDPLDISQVARYSTNKMDTTTWSSKVLSIARQWYSPIIAIERNGAGTTPCDKFFNEWNYPRMINYGHNEAQAIRAGRPVRPGIVSTVQSKGSAVTNMKYYLHDRRVIKLYDKTTITELRTFNRIRVPSGNYKWAAQEGFHDDHVLAMVWALLPLYSKVIDMFLVVKEANGDGIPLKIAKRWQFNAKEDYDNSLYKEINSTSPFVGVMAVKDGSSSGRLLGLNDPRNKTSEPGTIEYLLDAGQQISMDEYQRLTQVPHGFEQYGVRELPNW